MRGGREIYQNAAIPQTDERGIWWPKEGDSTNTARLRSIRRIPWDLTINSQFEYQVYPSIRSTTVVYLHEQLGYYSRIVLVVALLWF